MANLFSRIGDAFKPNSKFIPAGTSPMDLPTVRRPRAGAAPRWLLILTIIGFIVFVVVGVYGALRNYLGWFQDAPPPTWVASATLPNPGIAFEGTPTADNEADLLASLLLTTGTPSPTVSPTITAWTMLTSTPSATPTACTATHWQTSVVCDTLAITATLEAAGVGTLVNVSGVDPAVTTVYIYPTDPPTPWIITASPTWTPVVITATPGPTQTPHVVYYTAQPGPTQTPWFYITQPPVVTVVWTQIVTVEITREVPVTVIVVVTATPTDTPVPTETPTP